jgi:manganese/zinc/iron transport system substrate-binding protein
LRNDLIAVRFPLFGKIIATALCCLGGSGCAPGGGDESADPRPLVVATTTLVGDLAAAVAGDAAVVRTLMSAGVDPHLYKPSATDARLLRDARVIVCNGLLLEGRLAELITRMGAEGRTVLALGDALPAEVVLRPAGGGAAADPHIWGDVALWAGCVDLVETTLAKAIPDSAEEIRGRAAETRRRLLELDAWVREKTGTVPPERRVLVTSHDAFGYFGRAYGFEVLGVQGISTVSEAGLADVARMTDLIRERGVPAIFVESSVPPGVIERVSRDSGARIGGELFSDALGAAGELRDVDGGQVDVGTYEGMTRFNVSMIVEALR